MTEEGQEPTCIKNIFQVLIRDDQRLPSELPKQVQSNSQSIRSAHPEARYHLLGEDEVRSLMAAHFDAEIASAYDSLAPYSYKSDLARYCLLLIHGGLYVDLGVRFLARLRPPVEAQLAAFRDMYVAASSPWSVSTSVIFAAIGRPELRTAIDLIVQNCKNRYYGRTPLDPTGPSLFGRAIALCNNAFDYWIGDARVMTAEFENRNGVYVTPDGTLLALRTKRGNIEELGLEGTNNYNDIWHSRQVYGERSRCFNPGDMFVDGATRTRDAILFERGARGCVVYGPYTPLPAGHYRVDLWFDRNTKLKGSTIDVCANVGTHIVKVLHPRGPDEDGRVSFDLVSSINLSKVEVRLHVGGDCEGRFLGLEIAPR